MLEVGFEVGFDHQLVELFELRATTMGTTDRLSYSRSSHDLQASPFEHNPMFGEAGGTMILSRSFSSTPCPA